jgi:hypothetical protein
MEDFLPILAARWPAEPEKIQAIKDKEVHNLKKNIAAKELQCAQAGEIFDTLRQILLCREGESLVAAARARMSELAQKPREGAPQESLRVSRSDTSRCQPTLKEALNEYNSWIGNAKFFETPNIFWKESVRFFQMRGHELIGIEEVLGQLLLVFRAKR